MIDDGGLPGEAAIGAFNALVTVTPYTVTKVSGGLPDYRAAGTPITNVPVRFAPQSSSEALESFGVSVTDGVIFIVPTRYAGMTLTLDATYRITHNGEEYEILGNPVLVGGVSGAYQVFARRLGI